MLKLHSEAAIAKSINHDSEVIEMFLSSKASKTQKLYAQNIQGFFCCTGKSLKDVTFNDLKTYETSLDSLASNTKRNRIATIKSLFSFASKLGYIAFNPSLLIREPKAAAAIHERILDNSDIIEMIKTETNLRNKVLIKTLYSLGLRISEATNLKYSDIVFNGKNHVIRILGKGEKVRFLLLNQSLLDDLKSLRSENNDFIFQSRQGGGNITSIQGYRIIKEAGKRVGVKLSPHYLRHSHATHSLNNGCDLNLLSNNLGHSSLAITATYLHLNQDSGSSQFINLG